MIADAVASYLQAQGHGARDTDLFLGFQPDKEPDNCITVYDEAAPALPESHALQVDMFGVQVLVRNTDYLAARDALLAIHKDLAGFGGGALVAGTPEITAVFIDTPPATIGRDQRGRSEWSAHYRFRVLSTGDTYRT